MSRDDKFELELTLGEILEGIRIILERLNPMSQADIDAATAAMTSASTDLDADAPLISAALAAGSDTTALAAAVAPLNAAVAGINALAHPVTTASTVTTTSTSSPTVTTSAAATRTVGTGAPGDPQREVPA